MFGLGNLPDPFDPNDHDALTVIRFDQGVPTAVPRSRYTRTINQGGLGSCSANGVAQIVRAADVRQLVAKGWTLEAAFNRVELMSRLFAYYLARATHQSQGQDSGTFIRAIFQILCKFGFPPETAWSYDDNAKAGAKFTKMPSSNAFRRAFDQRLAAENGGEEVVKYSRIIPEGYARVEAVRRALADEHLVVFGTDVSKKFVTDMGANGGKPIDPPANDNQVAGGHAMVWGGYDDAGADTLNSWSEAFGDKGWFKMSWDYVASERTRDVWICERAPLFAEAA